MVVWLVTAFMIFSTTTLSNVPLAVQEKSTVQTVYHANDHKTSILPSSTLLTPIGPIIQLWSPI
jgi:hypothetical protein